MAETKVPVTTMPEEPSPAAPQAWQPFDSLRREIDRLFDDFGSGFFRRPFRTLADFEPFSRTFALAPAVDVSESENGYEITAELGTATSRSDDTARSSATSSCPMGSTPTRSRRSSPRAC
jgi:hypothetical protein